MFEEERALTQLKGEYPDLNIKPLASKYTAALNLGGSVEVLIDPIKPAHNWLTIDLIRGVVSPVISSALPREDRLMVLSIAESLEAYYLIEVSARTRRVEARQAEKDAEKEAEREKLLNSPVSIFM